MTTETQTYAPRRLSPDARRAQLLDHAFAAFAEAGIERAVHADIAQRAGVSTPTVFKYFPTREELVGAVFDRIETTITGLIEHIPEGADITTSEMGLRLARALGQLCETQPDLMKVTLAWSVAFSSVRERYLAFEHDKLDMLRARMSPAGADRSDARILIGGALLFIRMHFDGSTEDVRQRYVARMADMLAAAPPVKA